MSADEKRGQELAELAREFLLWLRDNDLPGLPGFRGHDASGFTMYAGIYRKARQLSHDSPLSPLLWLEQPNELNRLHALKRAVTHVLLVNDPQDLEALPDGRHYASNRIVLTDQRPLDRPGALMTVKPALDSVKADASTIDRWDYVTLCGVLQRTDLVYDDVETARRAKFRYPGMLDFQPPRVAYNGHVHDIPVPEEVIAPGGQPLPAKAAAERVRQFREYVYQTATYRNRKLVKEKGGEYYPKYRAPNPLSRDKREFLPTKLSDEFIKTNFAEHLMKRGDNLVLIELAKSRHLFRLLRDEKRGGLIVKALMNIGDPKLVTDAKGQFKPEINPPVTAVFFHALDGSNILPGQFNFGNLDYRGGLPQRYTYNYKAALRWYYDDQHLRFDNDAQWLDKFVSVFFGDQSYILDPFVLPARPPDRERLFLAALRQSVAESPAGPVKERLAELVKWCAESNSRYVFTQGMRLGPDDKPRELIGITAGSNKVFEWHPTTGLVTTMSFTDWLNDIRIEDLSADVYRNTAGMLPFITLVTWGGVVVMTGGTLGVSFSLGTAARTTVTQLASKAVGSRIAKKAAKEARPFLTATLVAAAMDLVPASDTIAYHFIKGFFQGFSGGAVEHYLSEFDERLERTVKKAPAMVANYLTKNGYTAYVIYDKVRTAVIKITGVVKALRTTLTDDRAKLVARQLGEFSQYAGIAFLVILFVVVYLDWVHRSRPKVKAEEWVRKQQQSLSFMITSTGQEVLDYSRKVRADLANLTGGPTSGEAAEVVRKHDQTLRQSVTGVLKQGVTAAPAVAEFIQKVMEDMGVEDWDDLKELGFMEVLHGGLSALPTGKFKTDQVERLGKAVGELVGTIMLERAVVPKSANRDTGYLFDKRQTARATKTALAGGTWRAIWRFAIHPFDNLRGLPAGLAKSLTGVTDSAKTSGHTFSPLAGRDRAYTNFISSLIEDEEELARRLAGLASDVGLDQKLTTMIASAVEGKTPPVLSDLLNKDDPAWPTEAILFVLYSWMRFGLHKLLEAFALIDDSKPYGGTFKLSELLDILGLDIALDDATVSRLMTTFTRHTAAP